MQGWGLVGAPSAAAGGGMYTEPQVLGMYGLGPGFGEHPGWDAGDGGTSSSSFLLSSLELSDRNVYEP